MQLLREYALHLPLRRLKPRDCSLIRRGSFRGPLPQGWRETSGSASLVKVSKQADA
jgi:hypothetical protein